MWRVYPNNLCPKNKWQLPKENGGRVPLISRRSVGEIGDVVSIPRVLLRKIRREAQLPGPVLGGALDK
jgi:hypothetical protein